MDQQNLPQSTPIVPQVDLDIGNIQEMDLDAITSAYDDIGQGINDMGQNIVSDIAGRQQQLIGNDFSAPQEGAIGNYNENTYIEPSVTSAQSAVRQIGTQVALNEGIRRSEEAAEDKLRETQRRYNEYVAEQNRKAAEAAARAANSGAASPGGWSGQVQENTISQEFLDKNGLSLEDFNALNSADRQNLLKADFDQRAGIDWDYKGKNWYATVDQIYREFGATGDLAKDERTGNQTQANKDFWKRADVSKRFGEIHAEIQGFDDGAKVMKQRQQYVETANRAIERWMNPSTPEEKALSFDAIVKAIEITVPTKEIKTEQREMGAVTAIIERINAYERGSKQALSDEERRELDRNASAFRSGEGGYNTNRMLELLDKAGQHTRLQPVEEGLVAGLWRRAFGTPSYEVYAGERVVEKKISAADVLESALGLTSDELQNFRQIKDSDPKEFERMVKIANKVVANNYISLSDGTDKADNYYRDSSGELKLARNGEFIIHYMPSAENDPALADLRKYLKDPNYMYALQKASNGEPTTEEEKKMLTRFEEAALTLRNNQIMASVVAESRGFTDTKDIYSAVLYDASGDNDTARAEINGRRISDWLSEFRTLARDDKDKMSEIYLDLLEKANRAQGGYYHTERGVVAIDSEQDGGNSSIGAPRKHYQDLDDSTGLALFMIIKKEQDSGNLDPNFLSKHPGADSGAGDKMWHAIRSTPDMILAGSTFLGQGIVDMFGGDPSAADEFRSYHWNAVVNPSRSQAGGAQRLDEHSYDIFRGLLDVQYSADSGEEGWYGKDSDFWVGARRMGGTAAGFLPDLATFMVGGAAKTLGVQTARKVSTKIATSYAERLGKELLQTKAVKELGKDALEEGAVRAVTGELKTFEQIGSELASTAMNGRGATEYLKALAPDVFKGLTEQQVARAMTKAMPNGITGLAARGRILANSLQSFNADIAGYTSLMVSGVSSKNIAKASPEALRAAVSIIREGGENGRSVFSNASRRRVISDAEAKIASMSEDLARGRTTAGRVLTDADKRSLRARIGAQRRRINNPGAPSLAREYGFQSASQVANKLIKRSADLADSGRSMSKFEVAKFLSRQGSDSARKEAFIGRFLRDEAMGNALFFWGDQRNAVDLDTGEHRFQDLTYVAEGVLSGALFGGALHLGRSPVQSFRRDIATKRIQKLQESLLRNAPDPENPDYIKKMNKLAKLTKHADRLLDDAMEHASSPDTVALFRKASEEAKEAAREVLDNLNEIPGFADSAMAKTTKELMSALDSRTRYDVRLVHGMTMMRAKAHNEWIRRTQSMSNLANITDPESNAKIIKSGFDSLNAAVQKAGKKPLSAAQRDAAMDAGLVEGLVRYGVNRKVAEREIKTLRAEYSEKWDLIERKKNEGVLDVKTFGDSKRGGYISPAGMTHSMVDDLGQAEWGLIFQKEVNADIAKPTLKRQSDMGEVISQWLDGKRSAGKGIMKVRNPEGLNLVTSLQTYSNMVESEIYTQTLDRNIIRNGDAIVIGAKNVENAIKEDKAFYKAELERLNDELKAAKAESPRLDEVPEVAEKLKQVARLQERLNQLEGVGLGERSVEVASRILGVKQKQFANVYRRIAARMKLNKENILKGGDPDPALVHFTDGKGNYDRDNVLEATLRHFDNTQPLYDATAGAGTREAASQYSGVMDDLQQATLRHRVGDSDYSKALVNEARRQFAESDAGAGVYGIGDIVQWVAERVPLSKKPGDGLDSLEWRKVSNAITRSKTDDVLAQVKADYEAGSALHTLAEALDEPRGGNVRLRGSEADIEADLYGEALEYRASKMEEFEGFSTAEKQEALDALDFLLREGSESVKGAKSEATLNRQFNLQEIVARNNLLDPEFDESPMFRRITDPETPEQAIAQQRGETYEAWEREVQEVIDSPDETVLSEIIELTGGDYDNWTDIPDEVKREIAEAVVGPRYADSPAAGSTPPQSWSEVPESALGRIKTGKGTSVPAARLTESGVIMPGAAATSTTAPIRGSMDEWADRLSEDIYQGMKEALGTDMADEFAISINPASAIGSGSDDLGPFGSEIRGLLENLREARAAGRISEEQYNSVEAGIRQALGEDVSDAARGFDDEIDFDAILERQLSEGAQSGRPLRRDLPSQQEFTIPRVPGARLSRFYSEMGFDDFDALTRAAKNELKDANSELRALKKTSKSAHEAELKKYSKALQPKVQQIAEIRESLARINALSGTPEAYVNRNGMKYVVDANGLQGYDSAKTLIEVEEAQRATEGFHPVENLQIRKQNKRKGALSRASVEARKSNYDDITKAVREAGTVGDDSEILIHRGLARVKSVEQQQFSSRQGFEKMVLSIAGFSKAVQNVQLAAGVSRYNAYSFRFLVSAIMSNPGSAVPLLRSLTRSRSIESVNHFYAANQKLFIDVARVTGDPFYIEQFSNSVSANSAFNSNYTFRAFGAGRGNARWVEQRDRLTTAQRKSIAEAQNLDSWRNAPTFDSSSSVATESSHARRVAKTVANFVEATWDDPTFNRFMPVLSGTMFLENYRHAIQIGNKRLRERVMAQAKKEGRSVELHELALSPEDINTAIYVAHIRTKLFFHPMSAGGYSREGIRDIMRSGSYDSRAIDRFLSRLTDEQIKEITLANQGKNMSKLLSSMFFALQYKATQIGQIANGIAGIGQAGLSRARGDYGSFTLQGSRNMVMTMMALVAAAAVYNEINGRPHGWDDPERLLTNLNELGKFRLGDGEGSPAIDPFFSQFTLINSMSRMTAGLAGREHGAGVGKDNPHRGIGIPMTPLYVRGELPFRLGAIQDELTANLLSPFKATAEVITNNSYFGGNIWEHPTKLDGTPNRNYDPGRNMMATVQHLLGFDTVNAAVKGDNLENDDISWVGGAGLLQHPYLSAYKSWQEGDFGAALFEALEMPIKWDNISGRARSSLNGYVVDTIGQLKRDYDNVVKNNPGNQARIDEAYESFTTQAVKVMNDWSAQNGDVLEKNPRLVAAAQRIMTGFFADQYDDNLMKIQSAYWRASIESGLGADFGWDPLPNESDEDFSKRIEKVNAAWFAERDKEADARSELRRLGFDTGDRWASDDEYSRYRNVHRNVLAQFQEAINGRVSGFENMKASKANYEQRIKMVDEVYTNKTKAIAKKTQLAEEHNQQVFDLLTPYVEMYGPYALQIYGNSGQGNLGNMAAEVLIVPANVLWKYATARNPEYNYLRDQFGVGWSDNSNLPSDTEFRKQFERVVSRLNDGRTASASTLLNSIIKGVENGKYGVTGQDWARTLRYREIINGRMGL